MNTKLVSIQKCMANVLLDKIETKEVTLDRAAVLARTLLALLPENLDENQLPSVITKVQSIPEFSNLNLSI